MIAPYRIGHIVLAASLALLALPHAADARGSHGGLGSTGGRTGAAMAHLPAPLAIQAPGATAPKQAASPQASSSQTTAATANASLAAAAAAAPASPPAVPSNTLPPSAIAAPAPQAMPIAPLSPPPATVILGSGGTVMPANSTQSSATPTSASPFESAPSTPGGGGDTIEACMGFWDSGTHMTKTEWYTACTRIQNRFASLKR